jgi:hypothetical protein
LISCILYTHYFFRIFLSYFMINRLVKIYFFDPFRSSTQIWKLQFDKILECYFGRIIKINLTNQSIIKYDKKIKKVIWTRLRKYKHMRFLLLFLSCHPYQKLPSIPKVMSKNKTAKMRPFYDFFLFKSYTLLYRSSLPETSDL